MNQSVATAARRHLVELESRVAHQQALIERLESGNRNTVDATRTLHILENALAVTKEHLRFILKEDTELCPAVGLATE